MERDAEVSARVDLVQRFLDVSSDVLAEIGQSLTIGEATPRVQKKLLELETWAESLRAEENKPASAFLAAMTRDARHQMTPHRSTPQCRS